MNNALSGPGITDAEQGQVDEDGLTLTELCAQPYTNCKFSAGAVEGHPVDTLYLQIEGEGRTTHTFLLRPDEAMAIVWVLTGALWSHQQDVMEGEDDRLAAADH